MNNLLSSHQIELSKSWIDQFNEIEVKIVEIEDQNCGKYLFGHKSLNTKFEHTYIIEKM